MRLFILTILLLLCTIPAATDNTSKCATSPYIPSDKVNFVNHTNLKCIQSTDQPPQAIVVNSVPYGFITCTEEGWRANGERIAALDPPLSVTCVNYCEVTEGPGVIVDYQHDRTLVTCRMNENFNQMFFNTDTIVRRGAAFCVFDKRWTDGPWTGTKSELINDTATPAKIECRKAACDVLPAKGTHFDRHTQTLTCGVGAERNRLMAIQLNTTDRFASLKCDDEAKGWYNGSEKVAEAGEPLNVTCVEYCASFGDHIVAERVWHEEGVRNGHWLDEVAVRCDDASLTLLYEDVAVCNASCRLEGWKIGRSSIHVEPSKYPQRLDCRVLEATPLPPAESSTGAPEKDAIEGTSVLLFAICIFVGIGIGAIIIFKKKQKKYEPIRNDYDREGSGSDSDDDAPSPGADSIIILPSKGSKIKCARPGCKTTINPERTSYTTCNGDDAISHAIEIGCLQLMLQQLYGSATDATGTVRCPCYVTLSGQRGGPTRQCKNFFDVNELPREQAGREEIVSTTAPVKLFRAVLAEFFCTAFLLFAGGCVNAQYIISKTRYNEWIGVSVGWGLALFIAVCMGHRISGAHLNPAVSFFQLTQGKISPTRFVLFVIAQNVGAFIGAMFCFLVYYDAINSYDGGDRQVTGPRATAGIFATYPAPYLSMLGGCFDQVLGTAILCIGIGTIVDRRNRVPPFIQPAFIGLLLMLIGMTLGMNCGYAINPARDFGPRLFSLVAGYGWRVFDYRSYQWFWIPIVCPMIGAVFGAWIYEAFIGFHMPDDPETTLVHRIIDDRDVHGDMREVHVVEKRPYTEHQQYHPEYQQ